MYTKPKAKFGRRQVLPTDGRDSQKYDMALSCLVGHLIIDETCMSLGQQVVKCNANKFCSTYMKLCDVSLHMLPSL